MYGALTLPFTLPKFSFSRRTTTRWDSVEGGVRGVPLSLQIVPAAKCPGDAESRPERSTPARSFVGTMLAASSSFEALVQAESKIEQTSNHARIFLDDPRPKKLQRK